MVRERMRMTFCVIKEETNVGRIKYNPSISLDPERLLQWYRKYLEDHKDQKAHQERDACKDERRARKVP
jgi:hypothetical protein